MRGINTREKPKKISEYVVRVRRTVVVCEDITVNATSAKEAKALGLKVAGETAFLPGKRETYSVLRVRRTKP